MVEDVSQPRHTRCLISGAEDLESLEGYERHHLVRSRSSGLVFCSRIPTEEELLAHYGRYGRDDYASPLTIERYHELLDRLEPYRRLNRILDVGCGIGLFLEVAKERGWEAHGTEYTHDAVSICEEKGIEMQIGPLDPSRYEPESFDVVTYIEVLEHLNAPLAELARVREVLRPGGALYFTTPNFNALERYLLKDRYSVIGYPEHLCYYTPRTIERLLSGSGFHRVHLETTGVSVTRVRNAFTTDKQRLVSPTSDDERVRNALESSATTRLLKAAANKLLTLFGVGNSLKGLYERPP